MKMKANKNVSRVTKNVLKTIDTAQRHNYKHTAACPHMLISFTEFRFSNDNIWFWFECDALEKEKNWKREKKTSNRRWVKQLVDNMPMRCHRGNSLMVHSMWLSTRPLTWHYIPSVQPSIREHESNLTHWRVIDESIFNLRSILARYSIRRIYFAVRLPSSTKWGNFK